MLRRRGGHRGHSGPIGADPRDRGPDNTPLDGSADGSTPPHGGADDSTPLDGGADDSIPRDGGADGAPDDTGTDGTPADHGTNTGACDGPDVRANAHPNLRPDVRPERGTHHRTRDAPVRGPFFRADGRREGNLRHVVRRR